MSQTNNLCLLRVEEINRPDFSFYIPSYQRGYRWDAKQVEELLHDIQEAILAGRKEYCLQPVVVKRLKDGARVGVADGYQCFEVIDGQQRLTTIYLILLRLTTEPFSLFKLTYETRKDCIDFFGGLRDGNYNNDNPDFAHISSAYQVIDKWVGLQNLFSPHMIFKFMISLCELLQVIWYELPPKENEEEDRKDSVKIFTRLNVGKIPLTSAELIKAIFLSSDNLNFSTDKESEHYIFDSQSRQIELANDWTQMEYMLQDGSFWNFINRDENIASTRIDFIFELVARKNGALLEDDNDVFRYYYSCFEQAKQKPKSEGMLMAAKWDEVKSCFMALREWFADRDLYHLIGYLIWARVDILEIYNLYSRECKSDFLLILDVLIGNTLGKIEVAKLSYGQHMDVTRVMVLFNALSAKKSMDKSLRFPFESLKLKQNNWSLEHIHAQNAQDINQKDYESWMEDHRSVLNNLKREESKFLVEKIDGFLKIMRATPKSALDIKSSFEQVSDEIACFLSTSDSQGKLSDEYFKLLIHPDHISNLTLLDGKSNSALNNSVFAVKRERVMIKEREGAFIPQATRNVFLKYYSDYPEHLIYWTIEDRETYLHKLEELITPLIKN